MAHETAIIAVYPPVSQVEQSQVLHTIVDAATIVIFTIIDGVQFGWGLDYFKLSTPPRDCIRIS